MAKILAKGMVAPSSRPDNEQSLQRISDQLILALRGAIVIGEGDLALFIRMAIHEAGLARDRRAEAVAS